MNTHIYLARHFHTVSENIVYSNAYKEGEPYVKVMEDCVRKHNIKYIEIKVSDTPRTLMTAMILYSMLNENLKDIKVGRPEIDDILMRDPKRENCSKISEHFESINQINKNGKENKLVLYVTHSSCYKSIYKGMLKGISNNHNKIDEFVKGNRISSNAFSYITNYTKKNIYYNVNIVNSKNKIK